ncbi:MAG: glutathione S-transferase family protein [Alphaproteobacteria bacterium]
MTAQNPLLYDHPGSICCQMARLALVEKGVEFDRHTIDIMDKAEQFEPWYTVLNPRAVVPTLRLGEEIITDTICIVHRVDADFDGPALTPADPAAAKAMDALMRDIMGLHYGVLLYSRRTSDGAIDPTIIARGKFLKDQLAAHPGRAGLLQSRIDGNVRFQKILVDPEAVAGHLARAQALVGQLNAALEDNEFVAASHYTLADSFATAALARFRLHELQPWWTGNANRHIAPYCDRMAARPSWQIAGVVDAGSERDL